MSNTFFNYWDAVTLRKDNLQLRFGFYIILERVLKFS